MKIIHPYSDLTGGQWLRGNLHAHSTRSDGSREPQAVIDDYAERGYGFLMLSDHDVCSSREECGVWSARGMVLIPGNEISAQGPHLLHVDADRHIKPIRSRQQVFNQINGCGHASGGRGFAIVNHPNWHGNFNHATIEQMREWTGYIGMEIYNGVIGRLDGSPYATNKWDILLAEGRRIWGFANDDSHSAVGDVELGWNTAYVKEKTLDGVIDALINGRFYASTGVTITAIRVAGDKIRIETDNAQRIVALQETGRRFAKADASSIEVTVPEFATYVRFECWGPGEKFAWTQPFYIENDNNAANPATVKGPRYIEEWQVSELAEGHRLEQASPEATENLSWQPMNSAPPSSRAHGFVDTRNVSKGRQGLVYFRTRVESKTDRRTKLFVGYDGNVRVWLNGKMIFEGPGSNPATPNKLAMYVQLKRGGNDLMIALDTNRGSAWGIFARVDGED